MARGTVDWFNDDKAYGFITPEGGGEDVFVHLLGIAGTGFRTLKQGWIVEFETSIKKGRPCAVNVRRVESGHGSS